MTSEQEKAVQAIPEASSSTATGPESSSTQTPTISSFAPPASATAAAAAAVEDEAATSTFSPEVRFTYSENGKTVTNAGEDVKSVVVENAGSNEGGTTAASSSVADGSTADGEGSVEPVARSSARATLRQPHVLLDDKGNEKTFGSALGLLTRKFVDILQVR